jgi:hypothetical protein
MIVHQCDSCKTLDGSYDQLPAGWSKVIIVGRLSRNIEWELCVECTRKPMIFGDKEWSVK